MDDAGIGYGNITMSQGLPQGVDLSDLPPEIRRKVEIGLAKLSPEMRKQLEQQGAPMLAKLVSRMAASAQGKGPPPIPQASGWSKPKSAANQNKTSSPGGMDLPAHAPHHLNPRSKPHGHYNDTIRPGDRRALGSWPVWVFVAAIVIAILEF
jgi:hypothetical protein